MRFYLIQSIISARDALQLLGDTNGGNIRGNQRRNVSQGETGASDALRGVYCTTVASGGSTVTCILHGCRITPVPQYAHLLHVFGLAQGNLAQWMLGTVVLFFLSFTADPPC